MASHVTTVESKGSAALWFGTLAGPAAWIAQVLVSAEVVELTCSPGAGGPRVFGIGLEAIASAVTIVCLAVTAAAGVVSFRCWRRTRREDHSTGQRARWMALAGMLTSSLSGIVIVQGLAPTLILAGCARAL
jgi:hypothetical protein